MTDNDTNLFNQFSNNDTTTVDNPVEVKEEKKKEIKSVKVKETVNDYEFEDMISGIQQELSNVMEKETKVRVSDIAEHIPTGYTLFDALTNGGIPKNKVTMFAGQPGSFKSALAANILGGIQRWYKHKNKKFVQIYLDSEHSTSMQRLTNLGIRYPKIKPIGDLTVEKVFKTIRLIAKNKDEGKLDKDIDVFIVWDSLANTSSQDELEADNPDRVIGRKQKLISLEMPSIVQILEEYNISLIIVNQLRDLIKMGGPYAPNPQDLKLMNQEKMIPGGNAIKFNTYLLMLLDAKTVIKKDKGEYDFDGHIIKMKAVKNKSFAPNITIDFIASYNQGYNNLWSNFNFLRNRKGLISAGPWWKFDYNEEEYKFMKKDLEQKISNEPEFKKAFLNYTREEILKFKEENTYTNELEYYDFSEDVDMDIKIEDK
jgi:RecA/RadA recombinase